MHPVKRQPHPLKPKIVHHHHYHAPIQHSHRHRHVHKDTYQTTGAPLPSPKPRMVSIGTQTDGPAMPQLGPESWLGYGQRQARKLLPAIQFVSNVIIFAAGRVNFGFGFKVPWLPYIGLGAP